MSDQYPDPISSVRHYAVEVSVSERDPYEAIRNNDAVYRAYVDWGGPHCLPTALPVLRYVFDYNIIHNCPKTGDRTITAKGWFGMSRENDHLMDTLYRPSPMSDDESPDWMQRAGTFVLPAGSQVIQVELISATSYDIDEDNRFRGIRPSMRQNPPAFAAELRRAYAGYRPTLNLLVRYMTLDGNIHVLTLKRPERGEMSFSTRPFDFWEKYKAEQAAQNQ